MSFIDRIVKGAEELEPPPQYWYWSTLAAISAVMKNNLWLNRHSYKLYPNLYVLLMGDSGVRKGLPIALAKKAVRHVDNTRVIAGRGSIQGIVSRLSGSYTNKNGVILKDSTGLVISGEFASSLVNDPQTFTILTDLYDGHYNEGEYSISLKQNPEKLYNCCITLLSGSNETNFKEIVPKHAISGGFIARTCLIFADKIQCVNSLVTAPANKIPEQDFLDYLVQLSTLKGEFTYAPKAGKLFDKWYTDFMKLVPGRVDVTGTLNRIHDQILKVAMCLSAARDMSLIISEDDIQESLDQCVKCIVGVKKISMGVGRSQVAPQTATIIGFLLKQPGYQSTRMKILQKFWGELDSFDLDRITETLVQAGAITIRRNGTKNMVYQLMQKVVDHYSRYKQGDDV